MNFCQFSDDDYSSSTCLSSFCYNIAPPPKDVPDVSPDAVFDDKHSVFFDDAYFEEDCTILSKNKWKLAINSGWFAGIAMIDYVAQKK